MTFTGLGLCAIDANQAGNANYIAATQIKLSIIVGKTPTTIAPSVSSAIVTAGGSVSIRAVISAGTQATGAVTFRVGGAVLGVEPVIAGVATLTVNSLSAGDQFITVIYSGDAVFSSSTSTISVAVTAPTNGSLDGNIQAVVDAQVQAGQRYMDTQIDNTFRRVEQLHDEFDNLPPGIGLSGAPTGVGASGGSGSTGNDPAVIAGAHDGLPSVAVGPYGELSYPGEAALPTKKGPSAASQEISNLSSTLPSAIAALDAKASSRSISGRAVLCNLEPSRQMRPMTTGFRRRA